MLRATVLIPTFDHGPLLRTAVQSVREQTVQDLEIFIIGDGVPEITREIVSEFTREDRRIRFFDYPKGPRTGERYRHLALEKAQGRIVCYLADDDLYFPDHVEAAESLLENADFVNVLPIFVDADQTVHVRRVDLEDEYYRHQVLFGENRFGLTCAAHSLALYRSLPHGWRTTPSGNFTDHYMWRQILAEPEVRTKSGTWPTALTFPSPLRRDWTLERRLEELNDWSRLIQNPCERDFQIREIMRGIVQSEAQMDKLAARAIQDRDAFRLSATQAIEDRDEIRRAYQSVQGSTVWRLRQRALRIPVVSGLLKSAAKALARRGDPEEGAPSDPVRRG